PPPNRSLPIQYPDAENIEVDSLSEPSMEYLQQDTNQGWITPGKHRKQRLEPRPQHELHTVVVRDLTIHIRLLQRVILLKTAYESTAQRLAQVCDIRINNKLHHVTPYFAAPLNSCKGVIHGVKAGLSTDELMTSLESYQATIITARMMGASESVLIIFEGTSVPYTVLFERVEYRCRPYQPKAAKCERCRAYGHRAINCSEAPTFWRCPTCATPLQQQQAPIHAPLGAIIVAVSTPHLIQHAKYSSRKTKQASKQHMTSDSISATPYRGLRHGQHRPTSKIIIGSERQLRAQHNPRRKSSV
ncbi:hypothetical protein HPB47_000918, partial [Ixodes persulcatus]